MKIGVISDTHDQIINTEKAIQIFNNEAVELVVHCGDWISPFTLELYQELKAPIKGVFGNNDGETFRLTTLIEKFDVDITLEERFLEVNQDDRVIAVFHGDYKEITDALVSCGNYDAVFHGHFHRRVLETVGKTLSLNPGSMFDLDSGGLEEASVAIYDSKTNKAEHIFLDKQ